MAGISGNIFREYDIRGVFGKDLTVEVASAIGRAYAVYAGKMRGLDPEKMKVTVGMDVRISSPELKNALIGALMESGISCVDLGPCPTPLQYYSMQKLSPDGGVMITGSHNPAEYNGFKVSVGKETIHGHEIQRLKGVVLSNERYTPLAPGKVETFDVISHYVDEVASRFALPKLERPIKVVLDSGNGTAGPVAPQLLRRCGCEVVELFSDPDGNFPNHHPDPTVAENLEHLIEAVKKNKADFGVSYDGDADRIGVVDERGSIIWGDKLMIVFSRSILEDRPGATIVGEVKCSQVMYDEIEKAGGRAVMWKTGHSLIKAKMKELKAAMAGEMSGHIFFADKYYGFDDAIYASMRLVEILARKRAKAKDFAFSSLLSGVPDTHITPEIRIDCPDNLKFEVIEKLGKEVAKGGEGLKIKDVIRTDGLRVVFEGGWALVRASNTQPVLVMRFEANSTVLLDSAKKLVRRLLKEALPGLDPGF